MRALGPGSVSSLLKLVLDVIFFALWAALGLLLLAALLALLLPTDLAFWGRIEAHGARGATLAAGLLAFAIYVAVVLFIVDRVRRIFTTLTIGDPFHPGNVGRLRSIGFALAGLELINYGVNLVTGWVFREGARLRSEAELTI